MVADRVRLVWLRPAHLNTDLAFLDLESTSIFYIQYMWQKPELPLTGSNWFFSPLVKRTLTLTKRNYVGFETSCYVYIQNLLLALFWSPTDLIICHFELVETIKVFNILRIRMKIFLYFAKYMHIQYHQTALSPVTCELVHLDWSEPELNEGERETRSAVGRDCFMIHNTPSRLPNQACWNSII